MIGQRKQCPFWLLVLATLGCGSADTKAASDSRVPQVTQSVADILQIEDDTKFAIAMSDLLFAREANVGYEHLSAAERVVFCLDGLEREVNNGGFSQFFENSAGDHALDTIEALRALGAPTMAALVAQAVSIFPGGRPATDRDRRQRELDQLGEQARTRLDQLDTAFYEYPENLAALERQYVRANQDQFRAP